MESLFAQHTINELLNGLQHVDMYVKIQLRACGA